MFEDKHISKFFYVFLGLASVFIPGPLIPIISFIIAVCMLVYKVKRAKESPEGFESLMIDIALIVIVIVVDIGLFVLEVAVVKDYNKYNYSSSSSKEMTAEETMQEVIDTYLDVALEDSNRTQKSMVDGFALYLELCGIKDINVKGNKITCNVGTGTIVFTVTKNNIKYKIK